MLQLILTAALFLPGAPQDSPKDLPTPEAIEVAVTQLDDAFQKGKSPQRIAALQEQGRVLDAKVVKSVARGLKDKDPEVQLAAIEALRWNPHPDALEALHQVFQGDKNLRKNDRLYTELIKAICQHRSQTSLGILMKNPLNRVTHDVAEARILGFGMIRDPGAVEGLMKLMQSVGHRAREPYMDHFRASLFILTGVDQGTSAEAWLRWWNENKKTLELPAKPPQLPKLLEVRWNRYWGLGSDGEQ